MNCGVSTFLPVSRSWLILTDSSASENALCSEVDVISPALIFKQASAVPSTP
jgi:hypothetical protein